MIGEIHLKTKSIHIPLASIFTSYLLKGRFRLLSLKILQTLAINHISSQNHQVMIGIYLFDEINCIYIKENHFILCV